tara:strand:+ start:864 stop:1043 length:180 start_codon:yes stop_codon:yes gene_type:complete
MTLLLPQWVKVASIIPIAAFGGDDRQEIYFVDRDENAYLRAILDGAETSATPTTNAPMT